MFLETNLVIFYLVFYFEDKHSTKNKIIKVYTVIYWITWEMKLTLELIEFYTSKRALLYNDKNVEK